MTKQEREAQKEAERNKDTKPLSTEEVIKAGIDAGALKPETEVLATGTVAMGTTQPDTNEVVETGFTDGKGNWTVTSRIKNGKKEANEVNEVTKSWDKMLPYKKYADDRIEVGNAK